MPVEHPDKAIAAAAMAQAIARFRTPRGPYGSARDRSRKSPYSSLNRMGSSVTI